MLDSCEHDSFIVVFETEKNFTCPICKMEQEIKDLENDLKDAEENIGHV